MRLAVWRQHAFVWLAYVGLAVVQSWPLAARLSTSLTGSPTGDTGVYVWNLWIFSHEIFATGTTPLSTLHIFPLMGGPADLSLHNYTVFSDILAMPLLPWLGIVATFNVVFLINSALAGFGLYLLARRLTGRVAESFVGGLLFMWSPFLVTRGLGHFSLAAAAPLPFLLLTLFRAWDSQRLRHAVAAGVVLAWAAFSDPYYAVYGLLLGAYFLGSRLLDVRLVHRPVTQLRAARHLLDVGIAAVLLLVVGVHVVADGEWQFGPFRVTMHTLFTPMLLLSVILLTRLAVSTNLRVAVLPAPSMSFLVKATLAGGVVACALMSPTLYAVGQHAVEGDVARVPVLWRSSAPGVDLLGLLAPNPNHPLAPAPLARWLASQPGGYLDQVASLSWIGLAVILGAWRWAGFRPPRFWLALTVVAAWLALGPFLQIAGVNTAIPTPWIVLRYLPIVGSARMPGRFMAVATMGFSVLVALALTALTARAGTRRLALVTAVGMLLGAELIAAPRPLYDASTPSVFRTIAADPRPVRVLELPTGVRDGLSSLGDFNADAQFHQTLHGKGLVGGYLSRVSPSIKARYAGMPVTSALIVLGEGRLLEPDQVTRAIDRADEFLRLTNLGYVVMNQARVTANERDFAIQLLGLTRVAEAEGYELYVPRQPRQEKRP